MKKDQKEYQKLTEAYEKVEEGIDDDWTPEELPFDPHEGDRGERHAGGSDDIDLRDIQGRPIETGHIVKLGMSDRQYVVVDFGGGAVEIAELGPTKGYDSEELEIVGELGG